MSRAARYIKTIILSTFIFLGCEKIENPDIYRIEDTENEFETVLSQHHEQKGIHEVLQICHFSDIHGDADNLKRILNFCNRYSGHIDCVLHNGDNVSDKFLDDFSYWSKSGANRVLNVIGNHDTAKRLLMNYDWTGHAGKQAYKKFFEQYISNWGVTQPENAERGLCYYYKDFEPQGIRLIVLDCMAYDDAEKAWLEETLSECIENGLAVICASHYIPGKLDHSIRNSFDPTMHEVQSSNHIDHTAALAVDTFMQNGGEFVCWLCGHQHIDAFAKLSEYPKQLCIVVAEALCSGQFSDQVRRRGDKSQDLFNMMAVDIDANTIKLLRVGADKDKQGEKRHIMCFDYDAMTVIYEK